MDTINNIQTTATNAASNMKDTIFEKVNEVRDMIPENTVQAIQQAHEFRKFAEETVTASTESVRQRLNDIEGVQTVKKITEQFIDERVSETELDRKEATTVQFVQALIVSTLAWITTQMKFYYDRLLKVLNEHKQEIPKELVVGSYQYYVKWCTLLMFAFYEYSVKLLPLDRERFEKRLHGIKSSYVDPCYTKGTEMFEDAVSKGKEYVGKVEPLKDVIIQQSATVETFVKSSSLGPIYEKGISSLKTLHCPPSDVTTDNTSDTTTDTSPIANHSLKTSTETPTTITPEVPQTCPIVNEVEG